MLDHDGVPGLVGGDELEEPGDGATLGVAPSVHRVGGRGLEERQQGEELAPPRGRVERVGEEGRQVERPGAVIEPVALSTGLLVLRLPSIEDRKGQRLRLTVQVDRAHPANALDGLAISKQRESQRGHPLLVERVRYRETPLIEDATQRGDRADISSKCTSDRVVEFVVATARLVLPASPRFVKAQLLQEDGASAVNESLLLRGGHGIHEGTPWVH